MEIEQIHYNDDYNNILSWLLVCFVFACSAAFLLGIDDGMDKAAQQKRMAAYCATMGHSESLCGR